MEVNLIDYARDPLTKLYGAYRTCYTQKSPKEVWDELNSTKLLHGDEVEKNRTEIRGFVQERLKTGHVSPLEQVVFWFGIGGVSRALSHQFVRHRIGISFEQQSQRYCKYKDDAFEFVTPKTVTKHHDVKYRYETLMTEIANFYKYAISMGVPAEDARFALPNAMPTNFQIMVNYAELLHIGDLRLCHRAQWEIRYMVGLMRAEVRKVIPELAAQMQPKCGEHRAGYCDESLKDYQACALSKARPHKASLFEAWQAQKNVLNVLSDSDIEVPGV